MVKTLLVIIILLLYQCNAPTPNEAQRVCSVFCDQASRCTGFSPDECKGCMTTKGWGGSPSCDITTTGYVLLDYSPDVGGSISVSSSAQTTSCP